MEERCRFCNKLIQAEFCENIFNNKQTNPSICEIVEKLTQLTIVANDPHTKLSCDNCFNCLILFYRFRESILQTNRLLTDNRINNTNIQNVYNKWSILLRYKNGRLILTDNYSDDVVDMIIHRDSQSDTKDQKTDKNDQPLSRQVGDDDNNHTIRGDNKIRDNDHSDKHCLDNTEDVFDNEECTSIIESDEDRKINENNLDSNNDNEQSQKNNVCIERYNEEVRSFLKEELDIDEACLKIENHSDNEDQSIDENNHHFSILVGDVGNNGMIPSDYEICDNDISDKHCLDNTEDIKEFTSTFESDADRKINENNQDSYNCSFLKEELDVEESCLKIVLENHSDNEDQKIDGTNHHFSTPVGDVDNDEATRSQNKISKNDNLDKHCSDITTDGSGVKEFTSVIDVDSNEGHEIQKDNLYLNTSGGDEVRDMSVVNVKKGKSSQHNKKRSKQQLHQCNICDKRFRLKRLLKRHLLKHTGENPQCKVSDKKLTRKSNEKQDLLTHTGEKSYQCNICNKKFTQKSYLKTHFLTHTGEKAHQCNVCNKKFTHKCSLKAHLLTHTGEKAHQCHICNKKFTYKCSLRTHLLTHTTEKAHQCNICNKKFKHKCSLRTHLLSHTGEKPHRCNICDKKFTQRIHLKRHLLAHSGEKAYQCNVCNRKYTHKFSLKEHLRTHTGERLHQCNICDKKFTQKFNLKTHLLTHTGERSYQCNICDKKFIYKINLKTHLFTHTGEKAHQCNICSDKFTRKCSLKKHLMTHTGERPHQCNICDKKYTQKFNLKTHLLTHTGEKSYQCNICDKKFTLKSTLKTHISTHTG